MDKFIEKYVKDNLVYYQDCAIQIHNFLDGVNPQTQKSKALVAKLANEMMTYVNKISEGIFIAKELGVKNIILKEKYVEKFSAMEDFLTFQFVLDDKGNLIADAGMSVEELYDELNKYKPQQNKNESKGDSK